MNAIGKISASEKFPTTVDQFYFWLKDDIILKPFDIVKIERHYKESVTYGIIEELVHITDSSGHIASFVSSDFGDVESNPETQRLGLTYAKCSVLSNHSFNGSQSEQIYMPLRDGQTVYFCDELEIIEALGLKNIENPVPAGFIEMSNNISVPICFNRDFLIGPEGAHLNISGISGLATKTSYAMFLLQALQQKQQDIAIIILNVKAADLLRLDIFNQKLSPSQREEYNKCGIECKPFDNVTYYYPFINNESKGYSNTHLKTRYIQDQHQKNQAFNYIFTYENNIDQIDLLFSNVDDPNFTIESILSNISEDSRFDGLTWESFIEELDKLSKKGQQINKDISVQSWRKFKRLIKTSISNSVFQECEGPSEKRQVNINDKIRNINKNEVHVVDIAKLDEQLQCFVFGNIIRTVYELKLGDTERADIENIPKKIVIFVDELNKYASSSSPKGSPILNNLLEITERGRSMGVVLFSAEQFRSSIHDRIKGNCSTHAFGRTNAIEVSKPDYKFIPGVFNNMMTRLGKGDLIIEHPIFRSLLKVRFPFPSYDQNNEE